VGEAHVAGLEVDARGALRHAGDDVVRLAASATWLFTEDRSREANVDGRELPYRPRTTGSFSAIFPAILGGELEASLRATSPVFVTRANTKSLQCYAIADLRWRRPLGAGLAADLLVSNLRDANARDFRDYPLPGRSLVFGIDWEGRPW
jgi:outer membrane cobalamin receptor